jgi:hypothetical protein
LGTEIRLLSERFWKKYALISDSILASINFSSSDSTASIISEADAGILSSEMSLMRISTLTADIYGLLLYIALLLA